MNDVNERLLRSATEAAEMLRRGEISSRELTDELLARIDAVNPALNAVVELRRDDALREAAAADDAIARGDAAGPLHGVPFTVKEAFYVAGLHTTWGNPCAGREVHPPASRTRDDPGAWRPRGYSIAIEDGGVPRADDLLGQHRCGHPTGHQSRTRSLNAGWAPCGGSASTTC